LDPVERYLLDVHLTRASGGGVKETSYYAALAGLLNEVGKQQEVRPRVRCVLQLKNIGAGMPDAGLFTADQIQKGAEADLLTGQPPSRGVIEAAIHCCRATSEM
jgi:hypothetical protein